MTTIELEGRLRFDFDGTWKATKWDDAVEYRDGLSRHEGTRAVDIIGTRFESESWFVEGKDPRGHRIDYRPARAHVAELVAEKVRDTIAGASWSVGRFDNSLAPSMLKVLFVERQRKVFVVLWLEDIRAAEADAIGIQIGRELRWLNPKVIVTCRALASQAGGAVPGLTVTSMRSAPP